MARIALSIALLFVAVSAHAGDLRGRAKLHYEAGRAAYDAGAWEKALGEFKEAYALAPIPDLLFNIGRCQEKLHQDAAAADTYEQYLAAKPDAPDHDVIENRILLLKEHAETAAPTPPPTVKTEIQPEPTPPPPVVVAAPTVTEPPPTHTPLYKRWWLWTAVAAVVVAGVGVGLGVGLTREPAPLHPGLPPVDFTH